MAKRPQPASPPASEFDITKIVGEFKIPDVDIEAVIASQRKNLDALSHANKLAFEGVQAEFKRQAEILRQALEEGTAAARELSESGDPKKAAVRQTAMLKEAFERAVANARELSEIIAKSNSEAFELLNKRFAGVLDEIKEGIAKIG